MPAAAVVDPGGSVRAAAASTAGRVGCVISSGVRNGGLRAEFLEQASAPVAGEFVAVQYQGRRRRQGARPGEPAEYESYRVVVER